MLAVLCVAEAPSSLAVNKLEENTWTVLPEDEKTNCLQCAVVDGKIYAFCFNMQRQTIEVHIYDPKTASWSIKTSIYEQRRGSEMTLFSSAVVGDSVYFFGYGMHEDGFLNNRVYCVSTNSWSFISPSSNVRYNPSACVVNGKIYVIGGAVGEDLEPGEWVRQMTGIDWVETFDPATNMWETKQPMPHAAGGPLLFVVGEKIYALGGYIEVYDTKTDQWTTLGEFHPPQSISAIGTTTGKYAPQKIYLFGRGNSSPSPQNGEIYIFDPYTKTFTKATTYPDYNSTKYPDMYHKYYQGFKVAVVDDVFYLIGGGVIGFVQMSTTESLGIDYRYVPLGYSVPSQSGGADVGLPLVFSLAGVVVAVAVLLVAAVAVLRFRHKPAKTTKND
jgi:hypothetical protein